MPEILKLKKQKDLWSGSFKKRRKKNISSNIMIGHPLANLTNEIRNIEPFSIDSICERALIHWCAFLKQIHFWDPPWPGPQLKSSEEHRSEYPICGVANKLVQSASSYVSPFYSRFFLKIFTSNSNDMANTLRMNNFLLQLRLESI